MATLFMRHTVGDFDAWKKAYDEFEPERKAAGVTSHGVYQADGSPTDVTVYHEFPTVEAARAFAGSTRLRQALLAMGVQGRPAIWVTQRT
jgi:hypothetical protein